MHILRALLRLVAIMFVTLFYIIKGLIQYKINDNSDLVRHKIAKDWGLTCIKVLNVQVSASLDTKEKPKGLIMSNHRSYLDIFILLSIYPSSIVAKYEIGKWPGINLAIKLGDIILVKRGEMSSMLRTMKEIKTRLDNNKNVILFPEGGIGDSHLPSEFKNGSFLLASKLNSAVTPIALWYEDKSDAWTGNDSFIVHFLKRMGKRRTTVKLRVMKPVSNTNSKSLKKVVHTNIYNAVLEFDTEHEESTAPIKALC